MINNYNILLNMVNDYKSLKEIEAIGLGGSSAAKTADNKSDYDIYIYGKSEPPVEDRRKIAEKYADKPEIDNHNFETGDVFCLRDSGQPIYIMYRHPDFIENLTASDGCRLRATKVYLPSRSSPCLCAKAPIRYSLLPHRARQEREQLLL